MKYIIWAVSYKETNEEIGLWEAASGNDAIFQAARDEGCDESKLKAKEIVR